MTGSKLANTIEQLVVPGKGILAADESTGTIGKRFQSIGVNNTPENRATYRGLLASTPHLGDFISGVILYEETLGQSFENTSIPKLFAEQQIVPGIKVDQGLIDLPNFPGEKITQGLDNLAERLSAYREYAVGFAKWRAVITIDEALPSATVIRSHAELLARYAAICQQQGIVPIVEPEVLMDGKHTLARCAEVTEYTLRSVFTALAAHRVKLEYIILKPNMVVPGKDCPEKQSTVVVAEATLQVLRRTVPAAVPSINFLSGGQSAQQATQHLQAMNAQGSHPWYLSFSYGRALQEDCLKTWSGKAENFSAAQQVLLDCAKANGAATFGK